MPHTLPDAHRQPQNQQHKHQIASKMDSRESRARTSTLSASTTTAAAEGASSSAATEEIPGSMTVGEALHHSYRVGLSGAGAMSFSVATLMWLHTIVTYQQRHGTNFRETCKELWRAGGVGRFYRGVIPSLVVAPLCRFGDTLSNELVLVWLKGEHARREARIAEGKPGGVEVPLWVATFLGSVGAAAFHGLVVPLDTYKVILQVDGKKGLDVMKKRIAMRGPFAAYDGALAIAGGSLMGHYPWYLTYNLMEQRIPETDDARARQARSAFIGATSSIVSATASNFFRVLKVYRQSHDRPDGVSYAQSIKQIVTKDGGGARGAMGVLGRGLAGRMAGSALQVVVLLFAQSTVVVNVEHLPAASAGAEVDGSARNIVEGLVFNVVWQEINVLFREE